MVASWQRYGFAATLRPRNKIICSTVRFIAKPNSFFTFCREQNPWQTVGKQKYTEVKSRNMRSTGFTINSVSDTTGVPSGEVINNPLIGSHIIRLFEPYTENSPLKFSRLGFQCSAELRNYFLCVSLSLSL